MKKLEGTLTIGNNTGGYVSLEFTDEKSHKRFLTAKISHEDLIKGIMGLAVRPIEFTLNAETVGKEKHTEAIKLSMPDHDWQNRKEIAKGLIIEYAKQKTLETGKNWIPDLYLDSQSSIVYDGKGNYTVNASMSCWE